ncbi:MAG TPA: DUF1295 domain-containing protein, partial [Myxococcales bacterium]|nr:DUF1295 domain-containing protein [Myxococcales bacterium]
DRSRPFCFSFTFRNSSFYDPYWSVTPLIFTLVWWLGASGHVDTIRAYILVALTGLWGMRLTYNFLRGFTDITHCDWRYRDLEEQHGRRFWLVSFFGIHFFSTSLVFMGSIPVYLAVSSSESMGWVGWVGAAIALAAIAIESIADQQLHLFMQENNDPKNYIQTGLWAWSRHPNYFGEVSFWWGLAVMGLDASGNLWSLLGATCMTAMFVFISIPLMETRMLGKRPHYAEHIQKVSVLVPRPPRQE